MTTTKMMMIFILDEDEIEGHTPPPKVQMIHKNMDTKMVTPKYASLFFYLLFSIKKDY